MKLLTISMPTDDRVHCATCQRRCKSACQPLRCEDYHPNNNQVDRRLGIERWPGLTAAL